ncbi:NADPH-dependent FMN reductase [Mycoplasmoides alvi]|uniref:NADPH-dependent FMN reductase n=1 Tax=Mycoplasmoides alvi TaxID=78580 RepID=UPI00051B36EA|nr:NADPH-dependent FMN reductase [Mycoplasmoides alvi]
MNDYLIIVGSNSPNSINNKIAMQLQNKINCDLIYLKDYDVPLYSIMIENQGIPKLIKDLENRLKKYKTIILFTPEHNGYLPSFVKNIFDWLSRDFNFKNGQYFNDQSLFIVCVSPGPSGGESVRKISSNLLKYSGAKIIGTYGIGSYSDDKNFNYDIQKIQNYIMN